MYQWRGRELRWTRGPERQSADSSALNEWSDLAREDRPGNENQEEPAGQTGREWLPVSAVAVRCGGTMQCREDNTTEAEKQEKCLGFVDQWA